MKFKISYTEKEYLWIKDYVIFRYKNICISKYYSSRGFKPYLEDLLSLIKIFLNSLGHVLVTPIYIIAMLYAFIPKIKLIKPDEIETEFEEDEEFEIIEESEGRA